MTLSIFAETTQDDSVSYLPGYGPILGNVSGRAHKLSFLCFFDGRIDSFLCFFGFGIKKDIFAGYVDVKEGESEGSLFYWFVGHAKGNKDAPIVVWSNGGPVSVFQQAFFFVIAELRSF